jgi:hypothetical protein
MPSGANAAVARTSLVLVELARRLPDRARMRMYVPFRIVIRAQQVLSNYLLIYPIILKLVSRLPNTCLLNWRILCCFCNSLSCLLLCIASSTFR